MKLLRRLLFNYRYFRNPPWDTGISPPELRNFIAKNPPGRALDIGCGTGTNVITLAENGWSVIGVDYAATAIYSARAKAKKLNVQAQFITGDITRQPGFEKPFDLILDIGCYHGLNPADRINYRTNLDRWLAQGGTFLLYCFLKDSQEASGIGLYPDDLALIEETFTLVTRDEGTDKGRVRSAWFNFINDPTDNKHTQINP